MGERVQGHRVDAKVEDEGYYPVPRLAPGEYGQAGDGTWYCCPPGWEDRAPGWLAKHQIVEHEDGTITVSPSILIGSGDHSWHGYLEKGVWREC